MSRFTLFTTFVFFSLGTENKRYLRIVYRYEMELNLGVKWHVTRYKNANFPQFFPFHSIRLAWLAFLRFVWKMSPLKSYFYVFWMMHSHKYVHRIHIYVFILPRAKMWSEFGHACLPIQWLASIQISHQLMLAAMHAQKRTFIFQTKLAK